MTSPTKANILSAERYSLADQVKTCVTCSDTLKTVAALTKRYSLFGNPKYTDLTVTCGEREWKLHKSIVCLQCDFFDKACDGRLKVSQKAFRRI